MIERRHLLDVSAESLRQWCAENGQPAYRAVQIRRWIVQSGVESFDQMTDLPRSLRELLDQHFVIRTTSITAHQKSLDGTEKLVLQLAGGGNIECVLLRDGQRRSICVSSQVGCAMGCVFCASGLDGVDRNLAAGEILEQMVLLQQFLPADERISHIVMMGMGEPLANLSNVLTALDIASSPDGLGISHRRITISTVGLPPAIRRLADSNPRYQLAVSLHAANDELRTQLVPVNRQSGLAEILAAADHYYQVSGRRLTFEYVLLGDLNDRTQDARQLAELLRGRTALLNVIPYNPVAGLPYKTPTTNSIRQFKEILEAAHVTVKFRQRKGDEINAACGQLRRSSQQATADNNTNTENTNTETGTLDIQ